MGKDSLTFVKQSKRIVDHLGFYLKHEISPVHQDIRDLYRHLERRSSLYRNLGLPKGFISGRKVLEVGPASGHNSLYVAACQPDQLDLLEPNPVAAREISELYENFHLSHTKPNVILKKLEDFNEERTYDIVICEAWLGILEHERKLMGKLSKFVRKDGILITTLASPVGFFFNMIRRLLSRSIILESEDLDSKTDKLMSAFVPHLNTLLNMSCPQRDWVQDSLLNPGFLTMHPTPSMFFSDIGKNFTVYNSYPKFFSDWRWYKSLYGEYKDFNNLFLKSYSNSIHNFLDYEYVFAERSTKLNVELEYFCSRLRDTVEESDDVYGQINQEAVFIIKKVRENISGIKTSLKKSIDEVLCLIENNNIDIKSISKMNYFNKCFGRELLYVSVLRDD